MKKKKKTKDKLYYDKKFYNGLKQAIRKYWRFYGINRIEALKNNSKPRIYICNSCRHVIHPRLENPEIDHIVPVGLSKDWNSYIENMIHSEVQILCRNCHKQKTYLDNQRIKMERKKS